MSPKTLKTLGLAGALLLLSGQGAAHHSTAMFDSDNPIELKGTVEEWQFTNPHTFIILEVEDSDGQTTVWELEGHNTNMLVRDGWRPDSLRPGDEIIVTVRPLHSGAPGGSFRDLRWGDGTPFDPRKGRPESERTE